MNLVSSWKVNRFIFLIFFLSTPAAGQVPSGVENYISGGEIFSFRTNFGLTVPDEFNVVNVSEAPGRLLVTSFTVTHADGLHSIYQSEVRQFNTNPRAETAPDFENGKVLVALESKDGEQKQICLNTINCLHGTAVYVSGWEGGHTLIFDSNGESIDVDWPKRKFPNSPSTIDYIRPITWLVVPESGSRLNLVCLVYEQGDLDPHILFYDFQSGSIETESLNTALDGLDSETIFFLLQKD